MVALKGQAQQHTADMRESASAASLAALRPPVQSPFVGATAREAKPEVSSSASQEARQRGTSGPPSRASSYSSRAVLSASDPC